MAQQATGWTLNPGALLGRDQGDIDDVVDGGDGGDDGDGGDNGRHFRHHTDILLFHSLKSLKWFNMTNKNVKLKGYL